MSVIYNLGSGIIHDFLFTKNKSERHCLLEKLKVLNENDVVVLDKGYFCYLQLYRFNEKNIKLVCRLQSGSMNKEVENFWNSEMDDAIIDYYPSSPVKSEIKKQGYVLNYKPIKLRFIKYKIENEIYVCATNLIKKQYPLEEFSKFYHGRWGIEELYKISINVDDFHGKSERTIKQEIYTHVLLINIARMFDLEANKHVPPKNKRTKSNKSTQEEIINKNYWQEFFGGIEKTKINFKNCLLVINRFIEFLLLSVQEKIRMTLLEILISISRVRQKIRVGRHYPRISHKPHNKWSRRARIS